MTTTTGHITDALAHARAELDRRQLRIADLERRIGGALYLAAQHDTHADPGRQAVFLGSLRTTLQGSRDQEARHA